MSFLYPKHPFFENFVEQKMPTQVMENSRQALIEMMETLPSYRYCMLGVLEKMEEKTDLLKKKVDEVVKQRLQQERNFLKSDEWKAINEKVRIKDALHLEYRKGGCKNVFSSRIPNTYKEEPGNLLLYQMVDPWVEERKREIRAMVGKETSVSEADINKYLENKAVKHESIKVAVRQVFTHYQSINAQKKAQKRSSFKKKLQKAPIEKWANDIAIFINDKMKDYEAFYLAEGGNQGDPTAAFSCKVTEFARDLIRPPKKTLTTTLDSISEESEGEKTVGGKTLFEQVSAVVTRYPVMSKETVQKKAEGKIDRAIFKAFPNQIAIYFNERIGTIGSQVDLDFPGFITLLQIQKCFERIATSKKSLTQQLGGLKQKKLKVGQVVEGLLYEIYCVRDELKETYQMGKEAEIFSVTDGDGKTQSLDDKLAEQIMKLTNLYMLIGTEAYPDQREQKQSSSEFMERVFSPKRLRRKSAPAPRPGSLSLKIPNLGSGDGSLSPRVNVSSRVKLIQSSSNSKKRGHRRGQSVSTVSTSKDKKK